MEVKKLVCVEENLAEVQQCLPPRVGALGCLSFSGPIPGSAGAGGRLPDQKRWPPQFRVRRGGGRLGASLQEAQRLDPAVPLVRQHSFAQPTNHQRGSAQTQLAPKGMGYHRSLKRRARRIQILQSEMHRTVRAGNRGGDMVTPARFQAQVGGHHLVADVGVFVFPHELDDEVARLEAGFLPSDSKAPAVRLDAVFGAAPAGSQRAHGGGGINGVEAADRLHGKLVSLADRALSKEPFVFGFLAEEAGRLVGAGLHGERPVRATEPFGEKSLGGLLLAQGGGAAENGLPGLCDGLYLGGDFPGARDRPVSVEEQEGLGGSGRALALGGAGKT